MTTGDSVPTTEASLRLIRDMGETPKSERGQRLARYAIAIEAEARAEWQERALTAESNLAWSEDRRADLARRIEERVSPFMVTTGHGFTCGRCKWGRDGYHDKAEYDAHVAETGHTGEDRMTPADLIAHQRAVERAATLGPWTPSESGYSVLAPAPALQWPWHVGGGLMPEDTALIVASRNDRKVLLDLVEAALADHLLRHGGDPADAAACTTPSCQRLRVALDAVYAAWKAVPRIEPEA